MGSLFSLFSATSIFLFLFLFLWILIFNCCYLFTSLHCYWYLLLFWFGVRINPQKGGKWEDLFIVGLTLVSMYEEAVSFLVYYALIHESIRIYMPKSLWIISQKRGKKNMGHWDDPLVWMGVKNFKNRPFSPMIWAIICGCFMTDVAKFKTTFVFFVNYLLGWLIYG